MSLEALTWAKKITAPSAGAKYLLIMLANYAGRMGESFYPLAEIAADMQVSVDSVRRRLGELQDADMIARIARQRGDGSRSSDIVILLMDDEARAYAESLGWSTERTPVESEASTDDHPQTPGIEPLADCDHPLPKLQGGGSTVATPIINQQITVRTPTPAARGEVEVASLRDEARAAEGRWEALKAIWPFDPAASPGKARTAFFALSSEDREHAIRYASSYLAATKGKMRKHLGNWLLDRDWTGFLEHETAAAAQKSDMRAKLAALHEAQRAKYGGVLIRRGSQQNAAWARYDAARGVDWRREVKSYPIGDAYVRPTEWPPSSAARDGPQSAAE